MFATGLEVLSSLQRALLELSERKVFREKLPSPVAHRDRTLDNVVVQTLLSFSNQEHNPLFVVVGEL